jgi:hypothetical protein
MVNMFLHFATDDYDRLDVKVEPTVAELMEQVGC